MFNKKEIKLIKEEVVNLKENFTQILDTLEGISFSKDWEEYQKYKKMKDKLPDLEKMYRLKQLKELVIQRDEYLEIEKSTKIEIIEFEKHYGQVVKAPDTGSQSFRFEGAKNPRLGYKEILNTIDILEHKIKVILDNISDDSKNKDLLEVFKLYGISTDWLQPK